MADYNERIAAPQEARPPVIADLIELGNSVSRLSDDTERLWSRLDGAMDPREPLPTKGREVAKERGSHGGSALANAVTDICRQIEAVDARLQEILSRLEV